MSTQRKQILLIDADDARRDTRVAMLKHAGYEVAVSRDHTAAIRDGEEASYDLVIIAVHREKMQEVAAYSEKLRQAKPSLPILLLTDQGVFVPNGTLSPTLDGGSPGELLEEIAGMLTDSSHIRELRALRVL